jgi:regulator of sigma E protease
MSLIIFFAVLALLVLSHELGHFLAAKRAGIRVDEFGFGFPPRLWSWRRGETAYSINLIPFGGFVKIFGENGVGEETIDLNRNFSVKPKWVQAIVLAAGVTFNILLAWILISIGLMFGLPASPDLIKPGEQAIESSLVISGVLPQSPAATAQLQSGDEIISLTVGKTIPTTVAKPTAEQMQQFILAHANSDIALEYQRAGEKRLVTLTPQAAPGSQASPAIGVSLAEISVVQLSPLKAIVYGAKLTGRLTVLTTTTFAKFIYRTMVGAGSISDLTGPVGLVGLVGEAASLGWVYLLTFTALISVNLAVINLLPIPALDGGRLLFLLIEAIKGSALNARIVNAANIAGFALLLLLMLVVTYHDIARLLHLG